MEHCSFLCSEVEAWQSKTAIDNRTSDLHSSRCILLLFILNDILFIIRPWTASTDFVDLNLFGRLSLAFIVLVGAVVGGLLLEHSLEHAFDICDSRHALKLALQIVNLVIEGLEPACHFLHLTGQCIVLLVHISLDCLHSFVHSLLELSDCALPVARFIGCKHFG